ncbi:MAG: hypothetical protein AAFV53_20980 [Myxococcota bacterium]
MFSLIWLALAAPASALTPPDGWTATDPRRALRDVSDPLRGELIEIALPGSSGDVQRLSLTLTEQQRAPRQVTPGADGLYDVVLQDGRVGRAMWDAPTERWMILLAAPVNTADLDPNALLVMALTPGGAWGSGQGGEDASWGASSSASASSWVDEQELVAWGQDEAMQGTWQTSMLIGGEPTQLRFFFDADGAVRLERTVRKNVAQSSGQWSTRQGQLRMTLPGGEGMQAYQVTGETLTLRFEQIRLTLYRQQG